MTRFFPKNSSRHINNLTRDTLALIMAGGRGSRLNGLTQWRAKPAVPFGGKFRIIDFPLSNCINSGIRKIGVLTQYKAHSLICHVQKGWGHLHGEFNEFVEVLPAQQRIEASWYAGTADAVYQNLDIIQTHEAKNVLILAGDHIYKMDYAQMLAQHDDTDADVTIACIEVPINEASSLGVIGIDKTNRIQTFIEKPNFPAHIPGNHKVSLCSMGIYIFKKDFLFQQLIVDSDDKQSTHDFGMDILPALIDQHRAYAYSFQDADSGVRCYWRDVGTIDAYWKANLELIGVTPELNLYDDDWPIWTHQEQLPPAKFVFDEETRRGVAIDSMVSGGCIISGATVRHSVLFSKVNVDCYSEIENSVLLPNVTIGQHCRIFNAIIDKGCIIPEGTIIGVNPKQDAANYQVSPGGVVLVTPDMLNQQLHHVR
ncbi:Glucose-1-phosphate adenylyltransferase [hydrothermal vent metagenome]|uniref:Glucose-1-phosphate adenylyltransferase n=1 Tax=hydrothermal vent metagenome TaxID=652676 RepID=A0A3B1AED9_9ZZZZ